TDGIEGTAMPGFASVLTDDQRWKVVAWQRMLSLGGLGQAAPEPSPTAATARPEIALAAQASAAVRASHRLRAGKVRGRTPGRARWGRKARGGLRGGRAAREATRRDRRGRGRGRRGGLRPRRQRAARAGREGVAGAGGRRGAAAPPPRCRRGRPRRQRRRV